MSEDFFKKVEPYLLKVQKPARYIGDEVGSVIKDKSKVDVRFAFCFPDVYDIGMSHIGMKILYSLKNQRENYWCERVFAPWTDFEKVMRDNDIPLYGLESKDPINTFDFIGFTLQYEMSYTNILNMLDLAKVPILAKDRKDSDPVVIGGGPCACNPEPIADFFDLFILGDGEDVNLEVMDLYCEMKKSGKYTKEQFLKESAGIEGVYVPSFYEVTYNSDGTVNNIKNNDYAPERVKKRVVTDLNSAYFPKTFVVPFTEIVHDRAVSEILRGCIRGCRFCQAGFIYRPFREKNADTVIKQSIDLCKNTGYDELTLSSLSTSDHTQLEKCIDGILKYTEKEKISLSLPSLRVDTFSEELMNKIKSVSKTGLTFAPEAGTQRMRNVINKNLTEEEILNTCKTAFQGGYLSVKLYFMMGLPTETDEDIIAIAELAEKIVQLFYDNPSRPKGKHISVAISCATFIPKPFTPFEFEPQADFETIKHKQKLLMQNIKSKKNIKLTLHNSPVSLIEAILARGDRRLNNVIYDVWKNGGKFESWGEYFNFELWENAMKKENLDFGFFAYRTRDYEEVMPWQHLDYLVSKEFFIRENKLAHENQATLNCREKCSGCGLKCQKRL
jgi:radical SAM family uncharacterized protein